jgi:hypothetical protein
LLGLLESFLHPLLFKSIKAFVLLSLNKTAKSQEIFINELWWRLFRKILSESFPLKAPLFERSEFWSFRKQA